MSCQMHTVDPAHEPLVIANALDWSARTGGALVDTEWGATDAPRPSPAKPTCSTGR